MTSLKSKYSPYIGSQAFLFYDTSTNSKSAVKSTESLMNIRPKGTISKPVNSKIQAIPSIANRIITEDSIYCQDIALRTFNRQTLSIIHTIKTNRQETTPKQTPKMRLKSESMSSGPPQLNVRCNTSERKPNKLFRIRGSTLVNPAYPPLFDNLKIEFTQKNQTSKTGSLPSVDAEPTASCTKTLGLERMCFNIPNQARIDLPLLIIHFEGVIGSCLVANKEAKQNGTVDGNDDASEYFFVKKDVKEELKHLSGSFLIAIVFPSFNNRYRNVIQHFLSKKFCFDGIYYKADTGTSDVHRIPDFILDYNSIIADFRARKSHKKVVMLLPLNLHRSIIKENLLSQEQCHRQSGSGLLDKASFLNFFPKINVDSNNLKIICLPNFLLEDKYEKFSNLSKAKIASLSKTILQICHSFGVKQEEHLTTAQDMLSTLTTPNNKENEIEEGEHHHQQNKLNRNTIHGEQSINKLQIENIKTLNLNELIHEFEGIRQRNIKFRQIAAIKESNNIIKGQSAHNFDLGMLRQKMVEDLADMQRTKRSNANKGSSATNANSKVSIVSVVGGLFNNNIQLFKSYEKAEFYSSRKGATIISDITKYMEKKKGELTFRSGENEDWSGSICELKGDGDELEKQCSVPNSNAKEKSNKGKKRVRTTEKQGFFSHNMRAKMIEEEEEVLALQQIKRLAVDVSIYLGD